MRWVWAATGVLAALVGARPAHASGFYGGAGLALSNPSDGSGQYYANFGYGGGIFWEVPRDQSHIMPEIDALYIRRLFGSGTGLATDHFASNVLEMPVLLRVHVGPEFSLAGGVYFAYLMGQLSYDTAVSSGSTPYGHPLDYGYVASLRMEFTVKVPRPIFLEARYTGGLANLSTTGGTFSFYDLYVMFGIKLDSK